MAEIGDLDALAVRDADAASGLDETQMAEAIGRLASTLDLLIAVVEQPSMVS